MKSFKTFMKEDVDVHAITPTGDQDISDKATMNNINTMLSRVSGHTYSTPYQALERIRQQIAYYGIAIPKYVFADTDDGETAFEIQQFGGMTGMDDKANFHKEAPSEMSMFLYFSWELNDSGYFEIDAEIMNEPELEQVLDGEEEYAEDDMSADAHRPADRSNLDEENIQELSPGKLKQYRGAAGKTMGPLARDSMLDKETSKLSLKKWKNRAKGIEKATKKIMGEEKEEDSKYVWISQGRGKAADQKRVPRASLDKWEKKGWKLNEEQIDELSVKTLASYRNKAYADSTDKTDKANQATVRAMTSKTDAEAKVHDKEAQRLDKKLANRARGIRRANKRLR
jgi:hypothetical protein